MTARELFRSWVTPNGQLTLVDHGALTRALDLIDELTERRAQLENEIDGHRLHYTCHPDRREP